MKYPKSSTDKYYTDPDKTLYKMEIDQELDELREDRLLVWHDEFDGNSIDDSKWMFRLDGNRMDDATVSNSICDFDCYYSQEYDTFRGYYMMTTGLEDIQYGRIEARMKWDEGTYPAFWLVGQSSQKYNGVTEGIIWPRAGEVDIMESDDSESVFVTLHYGENEGANIAHNSIKVNASYPVEWDTWHTFALEWTADLMVFYCDDDEMGRVDISQIVYQNGEHPFRHIMYIILSGWVSTSNPDPSKHYHIYIDWVRYYAPVGINTLQDLQKIQLDVEGQTIQLNKNRIRELNLAYYPPYSTDFTMRWYSTDRSIAKFNGGNRIETIANGEVDLSVVTKEGLSTGCHLIVSDSVMNPVQSIDVSIGKGQNVGYVGEIMVAKATVNPKWATNLTVTWTSSNENVATINSSGEISFLTVGTTVITAHATDNSGVTKSITVQSKNITDNISTVNCVRKFTRVGWKSDKWVDDLDSQVVMTTGAYFKLEQGLGYYFSSFTAPNQNNYASVNIDTNGNWSVSEKILVEEGETIRSVETLEIKGTGTARLLFMILNSGKIAFRMYDNDGGTVMSHFNEGDVIIPIDSDGLAVRDFDLNLTYVHHSSGDYECYVNGVKVFYGTDLLTMPTAVSPQIYIGSVPGTARHAKYYQGAVVYNKALTESDVVSLYQAFGAMFP